MPLAISTPDGKVIAFTQDETEAIFAEYQEFFNIDTSQMSANCAERFVFISSSLLDILTELRGNALEARSPEFIQNLQADRQAYSWTFLSTAMYNRSLAVEALVDKFHRECFEGRTVTRDAPPEPLPENAFDDAWEAELDAAAEAMAEAVTGDESAATGGFPWKALAVGVVAVGAAWWLLKR